ncbi:MAG: hypothetical protein D6797_08525 [Bdellovibrio sp.]|nr:MAG: hypothetical protein D6797_08525 [Bdellovibrio sp.]
MKLSVKGVNLDGQKKGFLNRCTEKIQNASPINAFLKVHVEKKEDHYEGHVFIVSSSETFCTCEQATSFEELLQKMKIHILEQLLLWKQKRLFPKNTEEEVA